MNGRQLRMYGFVCGVALGVALFTVVQAQELEPELPPQSPNLVLLIEAWPALGLFAALTAGLTLGKVVGRG